MPTTVLDVPTVTDQGLDVPHLTDPDTTQALSVLDQAAQATEVLAHGRHDSSLARLGTSDRRDDLLAPGARQPWDY
jgi:hypothetical protein